MQNIMENNITSAGVKEQAEMFVTFNLNDDIYGISVLKVQEIIGIIPVTQMPNTAEYLKGIINLRGRVLPVIDMRIRFNLEEKSHDSSTVILIVEVRGKPVGLLVDSVTDVLSIPVSMLHNYSLKESGGRSGFVKSIANFNDNLILLLDIDQIMLSDAAEMESAAAEMP